MSSDATNSLWINYFAQVALLGLIGDYCCAAPLRYEIVADESWISLLEGVRPAEPNDPITIGSFVDRVWPLKGQSLGSMTVNVSGVLSGERISGETLLFSGENRVVAAANPNGPFQPLDTALPPPVLDHFGVQDDISGRVFQVALRNVSLVVIDGTLEIGRPVDMAFQIEQGISEYALLGRRGDLVDLAGFPTVGSTQGVDPVTGSWDDTLHIPIYAEVPFRVCVIASACPPEPATNSRLALKGMLVARRIAELSGDFDGDGALSVADIDVLSVATSAEQPDLSFDFNDDGRLDQSDINGWIASFGTIAGDADLNGKIDFADFLTVSAGFGELGGWSNGNFDTDGRVAFADFLTLSTNFGLAADQGGMALVPEPDAGRLPPLVWAIYFILASRQHRLRKSGGRKPTTGYLDPASRPS